MHPIPKKYGSIHLAFLWHQHQPYYRIDDSNGKSVYQLPWVRLHAVKDYYDIPVILESFPSLRQNFNLVPSLLMQIEDYVERGATDTIIELTMKNPAELTDDEQNSILDLFFMANYERMIEPYGRYYQLLKKKLTDTPFSHQDFTDLQVWYNLCWVGESWKSKAPFDRLIRKGSGFSHEDKQAVIDGHYAVMAEVIPLYRRLIQSGQIECSVTPFYHPILPLLCDSTVAGISDPHALELDPPFRYPEDADFQIRQAIEFYRTRFQEMPAGMWPSEGSVSAEACALMRGAGIEWAATDQGVLAHSETRTPSTHFLPHRLETPDGTLMLVFRDHGLSDAIGFQYSKMDPEKAAKDFIRRIEAIRDYLISRKEHPDDYLVPVILDGENCWEFYEQNGLLFLSTLYRLLSESETIRTTTIGGFIKSKPNESFPEITRLHPGSWINHNFRIWIGGHPEENTAWTLLREARKWLCEQIESGYHDEEKIHQAREEIYIAEGSDWFWWFGNDHWAHNKNQFDDLFRYHLRRVYEILNGTVPAALYRPIMDTGADTQAIRLPSGRITPKLDGRISHFYEWRMAGVYESKRDSDTMNISDAWIYKIYFGSDSENIYIRVDFFDDKIADIRDSSQVRLKIELTEPVSRIWLLPCFQESPDDFAALFDEVFEMAVPVRQLELKAGDVVAFYVSVMEGDTEIIRRPSRQPIRFEIPDDYSDRYLWSV